MTPGKIGKSIGILWSAAIISCVAATTGCGEKQPAAEPPAVAVAAEPEDLHLSITGMYCDGCVTAITETVKQIDGVIQCTVSLEQESAVVTVSDPAIAPQIIEKINSLKTYTAELSEG